ncbi:MAG: YraN family protein [Candidatus Kapabacteria bacterium]|nr:YraN family protein [Candidatus Kapabacteria bacterium]
MENLQSNTNDLSFEKVWLMFQETDKKFLDTDKKFLDTDKKFLDTDKKLNKLEQLFTSQWGKLIESLVEGDLVNILNKRGIQVHNTNERVKGFRFGRQFEFDIIAENGDEVVVVEVKTTLSADDVKEFLEELKHFKEVLPRFKENKVFGAIAYLRVDGNCDRFAERNGLFIIRATGNSASIINAANFVPKEY